MPDWQHIFAALREDGVSVADNANAHSVGGGDISAAWRVDPEIFLKTGAPQSLDMFEAEAEGLRELRSADAVRVPEVLSCGSTANAAYLAMEWIEFDRPGRETERLFGQQLAGLHRHSEGRFGWHRDNTIGLTLQQNQWSDDWVAFFAERRIGYQLRLAMSNGFGGELQSAGRELIDNLDSLFRDYQPKSSLLHGDLWGGNWAATQGKPVIYDPAVYYGDRETDIAMTRLFGGFGCDFYSAYEESWPMEPGSEDRCRLYQLYHVLNHLNLFGRSYLGRAMQLIRDINSRVRR
ncbi:MAG: fructosamine kinase family protein, partial [Woeseia sp.]